MAAKKKFEETTLVALDRITKLAKMVASKTAQRSSPSKSNHDHQHQQQRPVNAPALIHGDGLEQWKDRLDEVKRKWVDAQKLPAAVLASTKHPDLFVTPAELDLACFLLGQRIFDKAEKQLKMVVSLQTEAELK